MSKVKYYYDSETLSYKKIERKNQKIKNLAQSLYKELLAWCFKKDRIEKDPIVAEKLNTNYARVSVLSDSLLKDPPPEAGTLDRTDAH